ncbi:MAG: prepilin peptidase [Actinoplanes sp.]
MQPRSPVIVLTGAAVAAVLAWSVGPSPLLPIYLVAAVPGLLLAAIDLRCLRLPDPVVGALAVLAGVPLAVLRPERIGVAVLASGTVLTAYLIVALLPRGGLGLGDVKLAAVLALILGFAGWPAVLIGVLAPHLINGPVALALLVSGRADRRRPLPFGPALLVGALAGVAFTAT